MVDKRELEIVIIRSGLKKKDIAKKLGISPPALYKKINNVSEFKASEVKGILEILRIHDKELFYNIFFAS